MRTILIILGLVTSLHARAGDIEDELLLQRMATEDVETQLMLMQRRPTPDASPRGSNEVTTHSWDDTVREVEEITQSDAHARQSGSKGTNNWKATAVRVEN